SIVWKCMSQVKYHWTEALFVSAGACVVAWILALCTASGPSSHPDQVTFNLMVIKRLHPDYFQGDLLYGDDSRRHLDYVPLFLNLQAALARLLDGDPVAALRFLYGPVAFLFLVSHYALFRSLVHNPFAAGLGVVSATTVRYAFGAEYWGFVERGLESVRPLGLSNALTPLIILAFLRWRTHKLFPGVFLLIGGLTNVHPPSGLHLAQITALTHLWIARFRRRAFAEIAMGAGLFVVGASPFLFPYLLERQSVDDPALLPAIRAAMDYLFGWLLLPQPRLVIVQEMFHVALPVALLLWLWRRTDWSEDLRVLCILGITAVLVGFVGTASVQATADLTKRPYLDVMQLRANKFMYLPLLAAFPLA